jgi:F-actin capping protein beta subunit
VVCERCEGLVGYGANEELYRYYEGGISSVYLWDIDEGFAGCVLLKKCTFTDASALHGLC